MIESATYSYLAQFSPTLACVLLSQELGLSLLADAESLSAPVREYDCTVK